MATPKLTQILLANYNVRPARIAFLMGKPEHDVLQEILEVNSQLWAAC